MARDIGRTLWPVWLWVLFMVVVVAGPVLLPGYVLSFDAVAVPEQSWLPDSIGVGEALPRAVPAEAVTVALTHVVSGAAVQKLLLVSLLITAGVGASVLVPTRRRLTAAVAATVYLWNPYVAERLVIGHWWLLLGYACLPWLVLHAAAFARGDSGALPRLLIVLAVGSLVPTAGMLSCVVALVIVAACSNWSLRRQTAIRLATAVGLAVVVQAPWWLPGLLHSAASYSVGSTSSLFAARADSPIGPVGSVLTLGGIWNADVVPTSRGLPTNVLALLLVLAGVTYGWRPLRRRLAGGEAAGLLALAVLGLGLALWTSVSIGATSLDALTEALPATGLLRDAQKFVALWALPLSLLLALAAERLAGRAPAGGRALLVGFVCLPLVVLPDLALGVAGRLDPVPLPTSWAQARAELQRSESPGDVLVLPWSAFRAFTFNEGRVSLDPAPRWLPRPSVVDGRLLIEGATGVSEVPSESERSRAVAEVVGSPRANAGDLAKLGVGFVVIEKDTSGPLPSNLLEGTELVLDSPSLQLRRIANAVEGPGWGPGTTLVVVVDSCVLALVLLAVVRVFVVRRRPSSAILR